MRRVLAVVSFVPYPADRGDPVRVMGILRPLAQKCELTVWCVNTNTVDPEDFRGALPDATVQIFKAEYRHNRTIVRDVRRLLRCVTTGVPFWIAKRGSRELAESLRSLLHADFDAVIFLGEASGWYAEDFPHRWHWDKFNVLSASTRHEVNIASGWSAKSLAKLNRSASIRFERRIGTRATTVSVTNDIEDVRLRRWIGRPADLVLPSVVSVAEHPIDFDFSTRNALWLGNLSYFSNRDGLRRFVASGWPILASSGWTLLVVGGGLTEKMRAELDDAGSVLSIGYVDDIASVAKNCALGIVPIWSGGGTKMKTLTMLAMGLPVVSTPMGFEGIPSHDYPLAATPTEIAHLAMDLHRKGKLGPIGEHGRRLAVELFSESAGRRYAEDLLTLVAGRW